MTLRSRLIPVLFLIIGPLAFKARTFSVATGKILAVNQGKFKRFLFEVMLCEEGKNLEFLGRWEIGGKRF
jgi:hypothetical protein